MKYKFKEIFIDAYPYYEMYRDKLFLISQSTLDLADPYIADLLKQRHALVNLQLVESPFIKLDFLVALSDLEIVEDE